MKRTLMYGMLCLALLAALLTPAAAADAGVIEPELLASYTGPGEITAASAAHQAFVVQQEDRATLYTFDGAVVLEADAIDLSRNWVFVQEAGLLGVRTYDGQTVVPCAYDAMALTDDDTAVFLEDATPHGRTMWLEGRGTRFHLDTGVREALGVTSLPVRITTEDGSASSAAGFGGNLFHPLEPEVLGIARGVSMQETWDAAGLRTITFRSLGGQTLLTASGTDLWLGQETDRGRFLTLYYQTLDSARTDIFSGRGRLLLSVDSHGEVNHMVTVANSGYCFYRYYDEPDTIHLYCLDGRRVALPEGARELRMNSFSSGTSLRDVSDDDRLALVDGVGVLRLPAYAPAPSGWAEADVSEAAALGLVDGDVRLWWQDACTREEFCRMVVHAVEAVTGRTAAELTAGQTPEPFTDCGSEAAAAASALGIVNGVGNGEFAPDRFLTRQQAAAMLARAAAYLEYEPNGKAIEFADRDTFADWAVEGISAVSALRCGADGIPLMQGKADGVFDPGGTYTVEQAAVTVLRLVQYGGGGR